MNRPNFRAAYLKPPLLESKRKTSGAAAGPLFPLCGYWKLRQQMSKKEKPLSKWEESFYHRLLNMGGSSQLSVYHHMGLLRNLRLSVDVCPPLRPVNCLEITFFPAFLWSGDLMSFQCQCNFTAGAQLARQHWEGKCFICATGNLMQFIYLHVNCSRKKK